MFIAIQGTFYSKDGAIKALKKLIRVAKSAQSLGDRRVMKEEYVCVFSPMEADSYRPLSTPNSAIRNRFQNAFSAKSDEESYRRVTSTMRAFTPILDDNMSRWLENHYVFEIRDEIALALAIITNGGEINSTLAHTNGAVCSLVMGDKLNWLLYKRQDVRIDSHCVQHFVYDNRDSAVKHFNDDDL